MQNMHADYVELENTSYTERPSYPGEYNYPYTPYIIHPKLEKKKSPVQKDDEFNDSDIDGSDDSSNTDSDLTSLFDLFSEIIDLNQKNLKKDETTSQLAVPKEFVHCEKKESKMKHVANNGIENSSEIPDLNQTNLENDRNISQSRNSNLRSTMPKEILDYEQREDGMIGRGKVLKSMATMLKELSKGEQAEQLSKDIKEMSTSCRLEQETSPIFISRFARSVLDLVAGAWRNGNPTTDSSISGRDMLLKAHSMGTLYGIFENDKALLYRFNLYVENSEGYEINVESSQAVSLFEEYLRKG